MHASQRCALLKIPAALTIAVPTTRSAETVGIQETIPFPARVLNRVVLDEALSYHAAAIPFCQAPHRQRQSMLVATRRWYEMPPRAAYGCCCCSACATGCCGDLKMHKYAPLDGDEEGKMEQGDGSIRGSRSRLFWALVGTNAFWLLVVAGLWMSSRRPSMQHAYKSDFGGCPR